MWVEFIIGCIVGTFFLFVPGGLAARPFVRSWPMAIACAPAAAVAFYSIMGSVYPLFGIACTWVSTSIPFLIIGVLVMGAFAFLTLRKSRNAGAGSPEDHAGAWVRLGFYVLAGVVVTAYVFIQPLDGPSAFSQGGDAPPHLSSIRLFADSADWSSFNGGFYPCGWYVICALLISAISIDIPMAANVVNSLLISLVLASGMFALIRTLFPVSKSIQWFGALCSFAFVAFPWKLLVFGPLYPYMASLCLVPATAATFVQLTGKHEAIMGRLKLCLLLLVELLGVALSHTGAIFVLVVFLTPYCAHRIIESNAMKEKRARYLCAAGFVSIVIIGWIWLFNLPSLEDVVWFDWPSDISKPQALINILLVSFKKSCAQPLLGTLVLIGFIFALRKREHRWMAISYAIACVMYFFGASTEGLLKHVLTGFWYTDQYRMAANAALFAIPLACIGIYKVYECVLRTVETRSPMRRKSLVTGVVVGLLFLAISFYPSFRIPGFSNVETGFGFMRAEMVEAYALEEEQAFIERIGDVTGQVSVDDMKRARYTKEEAEFMSSVRKVVGTDDLLVNVPMDGSALLFGLDGIHTMYRGYWDIPLDETPEGIIRLRLHDYAFDSTVQDAVKETGARYVLQLDADALSNWSPWVSNSYMREQWAGIQDITKDTPGFRLLLEDGDMRLYEIEDL